MNAQPEPQTLEDAYPLSPMQQGMLFNLLYDTTSGVDIEQMVCTLPEPVSAASLQAAWERVVARHPILRTAFHWQGLDAPRQEVSAHVTVTFEQHGPGGADLKSFLRADRRRGLDVSRAPLMRVSLIERGARDFVMVWTFHHALLDGRSFPLLLRELFAFYEAEERGEELSLPLPRPFRDYVEWLGRRDPSRSEAFFREALRGFTAPTPLPGCRSAPVRLSDVDPGVRELRLSRQTTAALSALAGEHQVSMNNLVQGAFSLLIHRHTGETDLVFGGTRACRKSALDGDGTAGMVGVFMNTLPLRVAVSPEARLIPWLQDLRARWFALREHEHTPLFDVRGFCEVPTDLHLFEALLVFESTQLDEVLRAQGGAWENRRFQIFERPSFPLVLSVHSGEELSLKFEYDPRRFEDAAIGRMLRHLEVLLQGMVEDPSRTLAELTMLSPEERQTLLVDWNRTATELPRESCIHHLVEAQVDRTPDAPAVSCQGRKISYRELDRRSNQVASALRRRGVGPGVLVGVCCARSIDLVIALLGVLKSGGAYVPLDPAYPRARIASILEDARAPVLLTQAAVQDVLPEHAATTRILLDRDHEALARESDAPLERQGEGGAGPSDLAYVIYTSGSTGRPKGVAIEHHSTVAMIAWARTVYSDEELRGVLFSASVCFDLSIFELFVPLAWGGMAIIARNALELPALPEAGSVTLIDVVPSAAAELVQAESIPASVITVNLAGEPLPNSLAQAVYAVPTVQRVYNLYGPTEDTTYSTYALVPRGATTPMTIGKVMSNSQAYVLDARREPCPLGATGELFLGGEGLARCYLNRPELTAEKFVKNPFSPDPSARLYRTGDLVRYRDDGALECLGRIDHQVKIRGFRIELGEIEAVLSQHPGVRECVAVVREDTPGDRRLVAYLASAGGEVPSAAELQKHCREKLPEYMIPSAFVALDRLPQMPNGKIDRKALPAPAEGSPTASASEAPSGQIEEALAVLFAEVLRLGERSIGRNDSFFALGGHSISLARLADRIERMFGQRLNLAAMYEAPTPLALARLLRQQQGGSALLQITPPNRDRTPLFWCGQAMKEVALLARYLGPDQPFYSLESSFYNIKDPRTHVVDYAARYLEEVLRAQPHGPYLLGGFCLDAFIAIEIAERLQERGEEVALLVMVERGGPDTLYGHVQRLVQPIAYHQSRLAQLPHTQQPAYVAEQLGRLGRRIWDRLGGSAPEPEETALPANASPDEYSIYLSRIARTAIRHYKPARPYSGTTALLFAEETMRYVLPSLFPRAGWDRSITGPVTVDVVEGDHDRIVLDPCARLVAEKLHAHLEAAHREIEAKSARRSRPGQRRATAEGLGVA